MEIRYNPFDLKLKKGYADICSKCYETVKCDLKVHVKEQIGSDCRYCRASTRPYINQHEVLTQYPDGCTCTYVYENYILLSCQNCIIDNN